MTDTDNDLLAMVKGIANEITNPPTVTDDGIEAEEAGLVWSDELDAYLDEDGDEVETRDKSASDFMEHDALDFEYTISAADRAFLGANICVTFGGPNIYVDTRRRVVTGYWGRAKHEASFQDNMGLNDWCAEMCEAGN